MFIHVSNGSINSGLHQVRINNRKNRIAAAFIWHVQSSGGNTFSFNPELGSKRGGLAWKNEALRRCKTRSRDRTLFPKQRKMEEFSSDIQHEQQWDPKRITKSNPFLFQMNGGIHKEQLFITILPSGHQTCWTSPHSLRWSSFFVPAFWTKPPEK